MHERAIHDAGSPAIRREGKTGFAAIVAAVPAPAVWTAINDEAHHALEGYLPVQHSEVLEGGPLDAERTIFQYIKRMGTGRWWASRVQANRELFEASSGKLRELTWRDAMDVVDRERPPIRDVARDVPPIRASHGAWLVASLGDECTLVEYYTWSDPGGLAGVAQGLFAGQAFRQTLEGIVRMAREHVPEFHPDGPFSLAGAPASD